MLDDDVLTTTAIVAAGHKANGTYARCMPPDDPASAYLLDHPPLLQLLAAVVMLMQHLVAFKHGVVQGTTLGPQCEAPTWIHQSPFLSTNIPHQHLAFVDATVRGPLALHVQGAWHSPDRCFALPDMLAVS
jgi:hypothetical protein